MFVHFLLGKWPKHTQKCHTTVVASVCSVFGASVFFLLVVCAIFLQSMACPDLGCVPIKLYSYSRELGGHFGNHVVTIFLLLKMAPSSVSYNSLILLTCSTYSLNALPCVGHLLGSYN